MDQTINTMQNNRIAYVQANWHSEIVNQARHSFVEECLNFGFTKTQIDNFDVPGSLEIPLQCKLLAKSGKYDIIIAAGLIVDGGIYRHDFVAATVLDAIMAIQLELDVPILSIVLTPHQFQETEVHRNFFSGHFKIKGKEAAIACAQTLKNMAISRSSAQAA